MITQFFIIFSILITNTLSTSEIECDEKLNVCFKKDKVPSKRYLLYDVNYGEGFNLKRDVYIRVATLAKKLSNKDDWVLVLPPWGNIYHWFNRHLEQERLSWSTFFDIESLNKYTSVIEFEQFIKEINKKPIRIDQIFYLQNFKEGWKDGHFEEKYEFRPCNEAPPYLQDSVDKYRGYFWGYRDRIYAANFTCVSFMGMTTIMENLISKYQDFKSIFIDRAEVMLHEYYGQSEYWNCRRSMRFAKHLIEASDRFREKYLDSNDIKDKTQLGEDWTLVKKNHGDAVGGPYLGVHLRRGDFLRVRSKQIPSLKYAAKQIKKLLKKLNLNTTFIASDATDEEYQELKNYLKAYKVFRYEPSEKELELYKDGGVAIIDQIICSHAFYFIGSYESTFSFRIQEEREILGFKPERTFNRFCSEYNIKSSDPDEKCDETSKWMIVY